MTDRIALPSKFIVYTALGYLLFIGMMAAGYYYNVTFIQLGLVDLGTRILGLSEVTVATNMSYLAIITGATAVIYGGWMWFWAPLRDFTVRLRVLAVLIPLQTILTVLIMQVNSETTFTLWIVSVAFLLGIAVPITFSMAVDLIAVPHRGYVAAAITALAYFAAVLLSTEWRIELFHQQMVILMTPAAVGLIGVAWVPNPLVQHWRHQHQDPSFGNGRFLRQRGYAGWWKILLFLALMFGVFFIDSLGFLRLVDTPVYMNTAWQSPDVDVRLFIGWTHVIAAIIAGILYTYLDIRGLFLWIFGIFSLVHLEYSLHATTAISDGAPLSMPMLYAIAVSLYTVLNFALWADLSNPRTVGILTAVGVALSGWSATFISTALAIQWQHQNIPLEQHLRIVNSVAIIGFLIMIGIVFALNDPQSTNDISTTEKPA